MDIGNLEARVFELEEIRIVIRADQTTRLTKPFDYERKASDETSLKDWIENRIRPCLPENTQLIVVPGSGQLLHPLTKLKAIRHSYNVGD